MSKGVMMLVLYIHQVYAVLDSLQINAKFCLIVVMTECLQENINTSVMYKQFLAVARVKSWV